MYKIPPEGPGLRHRLNSLSLLLPHIVDVGGAGVLVVAVQGLVVVVAGRVVLHGLVQHRLQHQVADQPLLEAVGQGLDLVTDGTLSGDGGDDILGGVVGILRQPPFLQRRVVRQLGRGRGGGAGA